MPSINKGSGERRNFSDLARLSAEKQKLLLERCYQILRSKKLTLPQIDQILTLVLENVGNENDCFWISHAWAESLIAGVTISKSNFPFSSVMDIRQDGSWKKDTEEYKGIHLSQAADSYIITDHTRGKDKNLRERKFHHLEEHDDLEHLHKHLQGKTNGEITMILIGHPGTKEKHALLATKLADHIVIIDNSMEPGPWVKDWDTFQQFYPLAYFFTYDYPEKVHGEGLITPP